MYSTHYQYSKTLEYNLGYFSIFQSFNFSKFLFRSVYIPRGEFTLTFDQPPKFSEIIPNNTKNPPHFPEIIPHNTEQPLISHR